jgi:uncharacterized protein (DUF2249 family)
MRKSATILSEKHGFAFDTLVETDRGLMLSIFADHLPEAML